LLDAARVLAVGQSKVGKITGEATATVEATMAGERHNQLDGAVGTGITEVMKHARAHGIAASTMPTARAGAGRPVAAALFDARLGQIGDTSDALGGIRDVLTWTNHDYSPDARGVWSLFYAHRKSRCLH
jgi:hypothetical protein